MTPDLLKTCMTLISMRHSVGQQMFCIACDTILDCQRAVEVTVWVNGDVALLRCYCGSCADRLLAPAPEAQAQTERSLARAGIACDDVKVEYVDGRLYTDKQWRDADMMRGM